MSKLNADLQTYSVALSGVSAEAQATPFASVTVTVTDVLNLTNQIVTTRSFLSAEASLIAQANLTADELNQAITDAQIVTSQSITDAGGLQGASIFSTAAQQITNVNASAFLPPGFTCSAVPTVETVPALSTWGTIILTLLLAATGLHLLRRTRSA